MKLIYRKHAIMRMFQRGISDDDIRTVLATGEVIAAYPGDNPYPSQLRLCWKNETPLHVLTACGDKDEVIVITAYQPDLKLWTDDFTRKRT